MKKIFNSVIGVMVIMLTACSQKIDASKVPADVKASFARQFPGSSAKWEKEDSKYEAGFMLNGNTMSAVFDANGSMVESEIDIKVADLPSTILAYIEDHYKGKNIKEAAKISRPDGTINYEAEVSGKDLIFDETGKFLKEVKD